MSATFGGTCVCHVERTGIAYTNKTGTTPTQGHQVHKTPADDDKVWHGRQYQMQLKGPKGPVLQRHHCQRPQECQKAESSGFRGVARPEPRLERRQKVGRPQVVGELLGDESLQKL